MFRIRFQSFVTATAGGAAFDSIHHTGFAPAVSVRGSRRIVNFVADPGRSMNPLAGSNEAVVPSALIETIAAFSIDPASTRRMSSTRPSAVATALPSSQPVNFPSSQEAFRGIALEKVQFPRSSRSVSTGTDAIIAMYRLPHSLPPLASSTARQSLPAWTSTGMGAV